MTVKRIAAAEKQRLTSLLFDCGVPDNRMKMLEPIIENVAWMKAKLDDTRKTIKETSVVIPYNNGGGQSGIKENPLFRGYESLWKSYMAGMSVILESMPKAAAEKEEERLEPAKSVLQLVREKHDKRA